MPKKRMLDASKRTSSWAKLIEHR